ncbi:family 2A encapsulin nanocompartment cargo protein cysteine desulfurase [Anaerosinus massiliensis]|uniref:family 2A encapsulin nanocompartment cargo protein cysteine desulfurase n=1 Tax=Massilibacillus massiliensis TaxID=1806837 RepID=UPI000A48A554|nr:family 2A encapsulin nanocompartment cargo protein cysteine desulfurase [Massilibacillus massiliensis]
MSINNCTNLEVDIAKLREDFFQQQNDQIPDPSVIAAMANVYFPEFGHGEKSVPLENGVPTVDFINAIPVAIEEDFGKESSVISQGQSQPFDFLGEARPIFTECENTADKHRNIAADEMIERDTMIDFGVGIRSEVCMQSSPMDVQAIRKDFPILEEQVNGKSLIWFDNAATTQKPKYVIERLAYFYQHENSNIHRAAHTLAARATDAYEEARDKVRMFLHAASSEEIVFVRGATEAINLVAQSLGKYQLQKDDEIIVSMLEHHANIVPWQMLCLETGAKLRVIPVDETGQILLPAYEKLLNAKTKIVAVAHVSNALGTVTPVKEIVKIAHQYGAKVLIDGAQAVSHMQVDVQDIDCDFYVFSGHKIYGPTGIGVLYGKSETLNTMHPYQGGGNMIADVTFEKTLYRESPSRFEAGTGNIADAVGLSAAIDYVLSVGMDRIHRYEHDLLRYSMQALQCVPKLRLIGTAEDKAGVISFVIDGFTATAIGKALSEEGIAVRAGHHCAQPILRRFGLEATVRASLAFYNTREEVDALVALLCKL